MSRCQHVTATRAIVRYYFPVFLFPYCVTFGESCPYKKTTTTKLQQRTHTQKQTKTNISDDHWDPQSELYHKQNPNSGPKNRRKPQTAAIAGSANPLKVCSESEIRAKILSGSVGPLAYSPPSLLIPWSVAAFPRVWSACNLWETRMLHQKTRV